jgi:hypothetical protein
VVTRLDALSISRSVQLVPAWRVLAIFERACDLVTPDGDVVALVLPEIGDGPLNVVVDGWPGVFATVEPGVPAWTEGAALRLVDLEIGLDQASTWEPRPDWAQVRRNRAQIESCLPFVQDHARREAPADSLLALLSPELDLTGFPKPVRSDLATQFAGLGSGLTPAGDDFLMGVMLRAWLAHPEPEPFCQKLAEAAAPRTTTLSAALLRAAARGECSAAWHDLLAALDTGNDDQLAAAVRRVLAYGHTSGADTLAGFFWLTSCMLFSN